jgi:hypothetical protein
MTITVNILVLSDIKFTINNHKKKLFKVHDIYINLLHKKDCNVYDALFRCLNL